MRRQSPLIASVHRIVTCSTLVLVLLGCRRADPPCCRAVAASAGTGTTSGAQAAVSVATAGGTAGTSGSMSIPSMTTHGVAGGAAGSPGAAGSSPMQASASGMGGSLASAGAMSGLNAGAGAAAGSGSHADALGVALAKPGDSKTESKTYLNLGDFRILVNKWGSDELQCNTQMKVFVNTDKTFGWSFDRGGCGGNKQKPDYPEIEFGIHPFDRDSATATTPTVSSTLVLPLQIKDLVSSSVTVDSLNANIQKATTWNIDVEFWLSEKNPVVEAKPGVYAELIAFWGWQDSWGCDKSGSVTAGDKSYSLCHQDDHWGDGWRYYQFRADDGPKQTYSGKVDIKAFVDWLVKNHSISPDLWLTRIEVGSEIDDNTAGSVTMKNLTFEVNGTSKSAQLGQ